MSREILLATTSLGSVGALSLAARNHSDYAKDPRPDVAERTFTAGSAPKPAPKVITLLQSLRPQAVGYLEFAVEDEPYRQVNADAPRDQCDQDRQCREGVPP